MKRRQHVVEYDSNASQWRRKEGVGSGSAGDVQSDLTSYMLRIGRSASCMNTEIEASERITHFISFEA